MTMKSSGRVSSSLSSTRRTLSSNTNWPNDSTSARRAMISATMADCISMGISGHHVEGEPVAVVNGDAVDVPGFTVEPERTLAVEWLQQTLANGDGHRSVEHAAEGIEPLDIAIKDGLNPLS